MRILLFLFLFTFLDVYSAQDCVLNNYKQKIIYKKVITYINKGDLYNAEALLRDQEKIPVFIALKAEIAWLRGDIINAEKLSLLVINSCSDNFPRLYYFLGDIYFKLFDYINAEIYLQRSIDLLIDKPLYYDAVRLMDQVKVISNIINNPVPYNPVIVSGVSTDFDEYLPYLSADQEVFFFTRRSLKSGPDFLAPSYIEEFISSRKDNGFFSNGKAMSFPFNQGDNEGGASMTIDNQVLYYTKCNRNSSGYNNCDIYFVQRMIDRWSELNSFDKAICNPNTWESQPSVSSDGRTIIFASDREGGYGNIDLYEINYIDGKWCDPVNLGSKINTVNDEKSPFLHADGKTLFFSSTRFPSLGGFDIFYSRKDSLGEWQEPVNIGYPINSSYDEISLFVSTDGLKAYFASNKIDTTGGWDIYSFDLHESAKPNRVLFLKGEVLYKGEKFIDKIELDVKNLKTKEVSTIKVNKGLYVSSFTLGDDDDVLITVKKDGFAFNSFYISSDDSCFTSPSRLDVQLEDLVEGGNFVLDNVYFESDSYHINDIAKEVIFEFSDYLIINSSLILEINGFTDNVGDSIYNQILSEKRALAVYNLILSKGIALNRVNFNGFGERFPISDNNSLEGRLKNRRTEIKVIKK